MLLAIAFNIACIWKMPALFYQLEVVIKATCTFDIEILN